jgi:eukaryotic-like serine/threonine-protein kinase
VPALKTCPLCGAEYDAAQTFCSKDGAVLRAAETADGTLEGTVIADRYRILKRLGEGGMGQVWLAEHVKIGRKSALKIVKPDMATDPDAMARFIREATNASKIEHPAVANIHDFGELDDGRTYLAMEFVEGESLAELLRREGPMPAFRAQQIVSEIAAGLQAAHDLGIVHRDLKPDNVMLARHKDGRDKVKLVDFGIAKSHGDAGQKVTRTGVMVGTPAYMSPEQVAGGEVGGASDQFALACSTFEMLTGALPFEGESTFEQITSRVAGKARRLSQVRADIAWAPMLQDVLLKGLSPSPSDRFASVTDFAVAFAGAVRATPGLMPAIPDDASPPKPATGARPSAKTVVTAERVPPTRARPTPSGGRARTVAIVAVVAVLGGVGAWFARQPVAVTSSETVLPAATPTASAEPAIPPPEPQPSVDTAATAATVAAAAPPPEAPRVVALKRPAPKQVPSGAAPDTTPRRAASEPAREPTRAPTREPTREPAPEPSPAPEIRAPAPALPQPTASRAPATESPPKAAEPAADSAAVFALRASARGKVAAGDTAGACRDLAKAAEAAGPNRRQSALMRMLMANYRCR